MTPKRSGVGLGWVTFAASAAAMIATPLRPRGRRSVLASVVVTGLAATTFVAASRRWGTKRAVVAFGTIALSTLGVERFGTQTGKLFGQYEYSPILKPQIAGVPAIVPLAWFAMAVPARETAAAINRRWRIPLGAALLTAWDLFLDPQMVGEGYWTWARNGRYRGIPFTNYMGWLVTSLGVMAMLEATLPPDEEADLALVGEYSWMAIMQTLGFAAFFRDPLVAVVGGSAMLPSAVVALRKVLRHG
jgi:uncharacterized membrane protein